MFGTALIALFAADIPWPLDLTKSWGEIAQQLGNEKVQLAIFAVDLGRDPRKARLRLARSRPAAPVSLLQRMAPSARSQCRLAPGSGCLARPARAA